MGKKVPNIKSKSKKIRLFLVVLFLCGFVYQAFQFLTLYWTYPTVVDIQQVSPSYVEVPAFTFCNRIGYNYKSMCDLKIRNVCGNSLFKSLVSELVCKEFSFLCINETLPDDFTFMLYSKLMEKHSITMEDVQKFAVPLEQYLNCTIEYAGKKTPCDMSNVLGSFYTTDDLPQFCYTIYSSWGQPDKERKKIRKGSTMRFSMFLNVSQRPANDQPELLRGMFNTPTDAAVQIAVHSPYFLPSPYFAGSSFLGGRSYELRILMSERHLLPPPYQTNCTDYMKTWRERNGKAPISQLDIIQECRINKTYEKLNCIPVTMDYPHRYNICKSCPIDEACKYVEPPNNCVSLADHYNQPCDSMTYSVTKEQKVITKFVKFKSFFTSYSSDGFRVTELQHDCEGLKIWRPECCTIDIDVPFDRFEITNITFNPKFESLELFSVIGGYMGMWLGMSLLTIFDIATDCLAYVRNLLAKRKKKKAAIHKIKAGKNKKIAFMDNRQSTNYTVW